MAGLIQIHEGWLRRTETPVFMCSMELGPADPEPEPSPNADLPLPELLVALRKSRGWTQMEVVAAMSEVSGATTAAIGAYETGKRTPGLGILITFADALALDRAERIALLESAGFAINVGDVQ